MPAGHWPAELGQAMSNTGRARATLVLNRDQIELLRKLAHTTLKDAAISTWPRELGPQKENVRNFARGLVQRPKPLLQDGLLRYLLSMRSYFLGSDDSEVCDAFRKLEDAFSEA